SMAETLEDMPSSSLGARVMNPQTAAPVRWLLEQAQWTHSPPLATHHFAGFQVWSEDRPQFESKNTA
ncbi:MAG: hypothetical protein J0H80_06985, partial [Rhizobiales bacterium]|nr:hypothetical protein [Hyphomicrobiales bacterium]